MVPFNTPARAKLHYMRKHCRTHGLPDCGLSVPQLASRVGEQPGHSLCFKDESLGLNPDNLHWVQGKHVRKALTIDGVTKSYKLWAEEAGLAGPTLTARLNNGWAPKKAVTTPLGEGERDWEPREVVSIGDVYGGLTVVEFVGKTGKSKGPNGKTRSERRYRCQCSLCGGFTVLSAGEIRTIHRSCGCGRRLPAPEIGAKFSKLTVVSETFSGTGPGDRGQYCYCDCDCGTKWVKVRVARLYSKKPHSSVQSCGCAKREWAKTRGAEVLREHHHHRLHGGSGTPEYSTWRAIMDRYGDRVTKRWRRFVNFRADMGSKPGPDFRLCCRDRSKRYSKRNCFWGSPKDVIATARRTVQVTLDGVTKSMAQWAREYGISAKVVYKRRFDLGYSWEKAFTAPHQRRRSSGGPCLKHGRTERGSQARCQQCIRDRSRAEQHRRNTDQDYRRYVLARAKRLRAARELKDPEQADYERALARARRREQQLSLLAPLVELSNDDLEVIRAISRVEDGNGQ